MLQRYIGSIHSWGPAADLQQGGELVVAPRAGKRAGVLEFAVIGLLHEGPQHGYELRKRLSAVLGPFHAISYGSLYPCLKDLVARGHLVGDAASTGAGGSALSGRRARIAYMLTADGKEYFASLLCEAGPDAWEDERFGVHYAFFARTTREVRMRILEGRRSRLEERVATLRSALGRTSERMDSYTLELQQHGLEGVEREVRWLGELIEHEQDLPNNSTTADSGTASPLPIHDKSGAGLRPTARG
jgi:DNA-binding PadR family transcriptional regulator